MNEPKESLEALKLRYSLSMKRWDVFESITKHLITWGTAAGISFLVYMSIAALAGKTTLADIGIRLAGNLYVSQAVGYILGGGGVAYGLRERKLRRDTVQRLTTRSSLLEKKIDPLRSSSTLTPRGTTREEDKK